MKKKIFRNLLFLLAIGLFFTACKKEATPANAPDAGSSQNEEFELRSRAENDVQENKATAEAFGRDFKNLMATAHITRRGQSNIVQIASAVPILKSLVAAVVKTGLASTLSSASVNLTVFAPTDNAFSKLPAPFNNAANISAISNAEQIATLKNILLFHVLGSEVKRNQIAYGRSTATTLKPAVASNDNRVYLSNTFGLLTVNGNSLVLLADVDASNGVIHLIDDVLIPPSQSIAQLAIGNPNLSVLVAALVKTNLAGVFANQGDFTVLAPTNAAFAKLPAPFNSAAAINAISDAGQISALANILKYHVTGSRYFSLDFGILSPIETLASAPNNRVIGVLGLNTAAVKGNKNTFFSIANPVNLLATNGVVHVINQVLIP